jgi:DNA-binding MarR family transcriptional regulator
MARRSPAQLTALQLIAEGGVTAYEFRHIGRTRVTARNGAPINTATFRTLERAGLITRDTSTSLFNGQAVSLTDAGRAELPKPERLRIELVVHRDPDAETATTWFVNGRPLAEADVDVTEYHVDPGADGTGPEWVDDREADIKDASEAAAAKVRQLVGYYA